jgi:very-short-patch-repair endonuclease
MPELTMTVIIQGRAVVLTKTEASALSRRLKQGVARLRIGKISINLDALGTSDLIAKRTGERQWKELTTAQKRQKLIDERPESEKAFDARLAAAGITYDIQIRIGRYFADFVIAPKTVVEIDGSIHRTPKRQAYDLKRDAFMRKAGYTVIRIPNEGVTVYPLDRFPIGASRQADIRVNAEVDTVCSDCGNKIQRHERAWKSDGGIVCAFCWHTRNAFETAKPSRSKCPHCGRSIAVSNGVLMPHKASKRKFDVCPWSKRPIAV